MLITTGLNAGLPRYILVILLGRRGTSEEAMPRSPFLNDPYDQVASHIAAAVLSPVEELRAMHIRAAEHLSEVARLSGVERAMRSQVRQRRNQTSGT